VAYLSLCRKGSSALHAWLLIAGEGGALVHVLSHI
jgi:hypothetical protein